MGRPLVDESVPDQRSDELNQVAQPNPRAAGQALLGHGSGNLHFIRGLRGLQEVEENAFLRGEAHPSQHPVLHRTRVRW